MRNEKNILRHELIGLDCIVTESRNASLVGIRGKIVDETMKTLVIGKDRKRVAKQDNRFEIMIGKRKVIIEGSAIVARPEDRIKKKFKKW